MYLDGCLDSLSLFGTLWITEEEERNHCHWMHHQMFGDIDSFDIDIRRSIWGDG